MHSDAEILKAYLAEREVPCPKCGYSLKGCVSESCPECARPFALGVMREDWISKHRRLFLAGLWVACFYHALIVAFFVAEVVQSGLPPWAGMPVPFAAITAATRLLTCLGLVVSIALLAAARRARRSPARLEPVLTVFLWAVIAESLGYAALEGAVWLMF